MNRDQKSLNSKIRSQFLELFRSAIVYKYPFTDLKKLSISQKGNLTGN